MRAPDTKRPYPGPAPDETSRLEALQAYSILDTLEEKDFDDLTSLAAAICDIPISLVSLVDKDRQWFKSHHGLPVRETDRAVSFCSHAIIDPQHSMTVPDARLDERFAANPLVTGEPRLVFYMGVPLLSPEGFALGTLCVVDHRPRELTPAQQDSLRILARQVMDKLELRKKTIALEETMGMLSAAMQVSKSGTFSFDLRLDRIQADAQFCELLALTPKNLSVESIWKSIPANDGRRLKAIIQRATNAGAGFSGEFRTEVTGRDTGWCLVSGRVIPASEGNTGKIIGVVQDISDRKERQAAKDAFLGAVSHELKTPITALKSGLQLFRTYIDRLSKESLLGLVDRSVRSVDRINGLVDDLLQMHFLQERQLVPSKRRLNISELIERCLDDLPDYSLRLHLTGAKSCYVNGDSNQIEQLVHNLVDHALQRTRNQVLKIHVERDDDYVRVSIDPVFYHEGFAPDNEMFRRFSITDLPRLKKTGLAIGLYLCSEIVRDHGGDIGVQPLPDSSSRLWFRMQLLPGEKPEK